MPPAVATKEPTEITAGDSLQWNRSLSLYPASDGWALSYVLTGAHPQPIAISTSDSDGTYQVRVTASTTATYTPGAYRLTGYATLGDDRFQVYRGRVEVLPDDATAVPEVSHAERMVGLLEAAMQGVAEGGVVEYTVAGRGVKKITLAEARSELAHWRQELNTERGVSPFRRVEVAFAPVD